MFIKLKSLLKDNYLFIIGLLLTILVLWPMARDGFYAHHDDVQVIRLHQMNECIQDGQIPCRWVPDLGGLYGYPLFNYYAPLPYYVGEIFYLISGSLIFSAKLMFATSFIGAYVFMYLLAKKYWGEKGALVSAVFYSYAPYHAANLYVRGAMGEMWAMMWYPAILWSFTRLSQKLSLKNIAVSGLFIAALVTSHNLSAMLFLPILLIFIAILWLNKKNKRLLYYSACALILGLLLSAFYWLPALYEKQYVHVDTTTVGYFSYTEHYKGLRKLFVEQSWDWGPSIREIPGGEQDANWYKVGWVHTAYWIISILIAFGLYKRRKDRQKAYMILFSSVIILLMVFMIHPRSLSVWKIFDEYIRFVQFPWRLLMFISFFVSFVSGSVLLGVKKDKRLAVAVVSVLLVIVSTFSFFKPEKYTDITDTSVLTGEIWEKQINRSIFDYLPMYAELPPDTLASERYTVLEGDLVVEDIEEKSNKISLNVNTEEPSVLQISQYYFPGWVVEVDGKVQDINYDNDLGLMTINVISGDQLIEFVFLNTFIRTLANLLTIAGLIIVTYLLFKNISVKH